MFLLYVEYVIGLAIRFCLVHGKTEKKKGCKMSEKLHVFRGLAP
jgi:hypothetical protein